MARLGHYELCAAGGAERAGAMWLGEAYQRGGWAWLRSRIRDAKARLVQAGGRLDFFVLKYFPGQGTDLEGKPEPMVLDLLEARDRGCISDVIGPAPMQGRMGLASLSRWADVQHLGKYMYLGKAPDLERLQELLANPRDLEFVTGWFNALAGLGWRLILDSASLPEHTDESSEFIHAMALHGCKATAWDAEAYCIGGGAVPRGTWPHVPGIRCWGENSAWAASGLPGSASETVTDIGLLHTGGAASPDVLAAAGMADGMIGMNVNAIDASELEVIVRVAAGAVEGGAA